MDCGRRRTGQKPCLRKAAGAVPRAGASILAGALEILEMASRDGLYISVYVSGLLLAGRWIPVRERSGRAESNIHAGHPGGAGLCRPILSDTSFTRVTLRREEEGKFSLVVETIRMRVCSGDWFVRPRRSVSRKAGDG